MSSNALWRVKPYLKPHLRTMAGMTLAALAGLGASTIVPLLIKAVIDGPLREGRRSGIVFLSLCVLALITALSAIPLAAACRRFEREYLVVSRRVQDQDGDLTTLVEEGATGIRAIKAFGRRRLVLRSFMVQAEKLYDSSLEQVRLRA